MTPLSGTLSVAAQIDGECAHPMPGHAAGEAFVPAGMFAEPMNNRKGDRGARHRPGTVSQRCAVSRLDRPLPVERLLSWQGVQSL